MPFTASIIFTGVCGLVPKKDPTHPPAPQTSPEAFCVVLPNAWKRQHDARGMKRSLDGFSRLRRHSPFVCFTTHPWDLMNQRRDLEGLWYLQGHRLMIDPTFSPTPEGTQPIGPAWGNIAGLAGFEDIVPTEKKGLLSVTEAITAPDPEKIAAQVFLQHGTLDSVELDADWVFDSFLRPTKPTVIKRLNHQFTVTLENLEELTVVQQTFAGEPTGRSFTFTQGDEACITVANLCDQNPLQWGEAPPPESLTDDEDFRWYYEIVDKPHKLSGALNHLRCPIPRLAQAPDHGAPLIGGGGLSCIGFRYPGVDDFPV